MVGTIKKKTTPYGEQDPLALAQAYSRKLGIAPTVFKRYEAMHYADQVKSLHIHFPENLVKKWGCLELLQMTDMQFGHVCCNVKKVEEYRDWILAQPNRFMLWTGDNVDAWRLGSPGSPFEQTSEPRVQVREFCKIWAPAAHRILGHVGGNHERRATIGFGDLGSLISEFLQLPYSGGQQFVNIQFGEWKNFTIDLFHGRGAGRTKGAKINMLFDFMQQSDAHWCLVGHLHDVIDTWRWRRVRDAKSMGIRFEKQGGSMSSSFMEWVGSYGEVAGMSATGCMMACAVLEPNGHWELRRR